MTKGEIVDAAVAGLQSAPRDYYNILLVLRDRKEVTAAKHLDDPGSTVVRLPL